METIGKLNVTTERYIDWKILSFSSLSEENSIGYCSPNFDFCNESWCLKMYPNGIDEASTGYVSLFLTKKSSGPPIKIEFYLYLEALSGLEGPSEEGLEENTETDLQSTFEQANSEHGYHKFLLRSELFENKTDFLPSDVMTVYCTLYFPTSVETPAFEKFSSDFKAIMLSGDYSDIVVKVKTEEFRVHRSIMAARSSYFDAMFKSGMRENFTGIITIPDCEPNIFRSFIHFVYSGKVVSLENLFELYTMADKYQEDQLKNICLKYMSDTMSVDHFCNYFLLAFIHDEKELLQKSIEFFTTNGKEVVRSVKWQEFLIEYPTQANELLIKYFDDMSA